MSDERVMELHKGEWRPSCPLPYYLWWGRCRCACGQRFKNESLYERHWRSSHGDRFVDERRLRRTTSAAVWAEEFAKVCPEVDQGLMIGWFANAMATMRDHLTADSNTPPERLAGSEAP